MSKGVLVVLIAASFAVSTAVPGFGQESAGEVLDERPAAEASISGTLLTLSPRVDYTHALVRVVDPHHYEAREVFDRGGALTIDLLADGWLTVATEQGGTERNSPRSRDAMRPVEQRVVPVALSDGRYHYELFMTVFDGVVEHFYGTISVSHGAATLEPAPADADLERRESTLRPSGLNPVGTVEGPSSEGDSTTEFFEIDDANANGHTRLTLEESSGASELWEFINSDGDFFLCETGSVSGGTCETAFSFRERSTGRLLGIGTQAPAVDVHIANGNPELRIEDTNPSGGVWDLQSLSGGLVIEDALTGNDVVTVAADAPSLALNINGSGEVGLGTANPEDRLHLRHTDPTIRFTETDGNESVFRLRVDTVSGNRRFVIQEGDAFQPLLSIDQDTGRVGLGNASLAGAALDIAPREGDTHLRLASSDGFGWTIDGGRHAMTVGREGSGGNGLIVRDRFDADGPTLAVAGSVVGTQCINTSSRELKTGFAAVDHAEILARLAQLPITSWRYRHEPEEARHLGAVAEDFQRLFGVGDGRTISTVDAAGVLMAAVQGLAEENRELRLRLETLERAEASVTAQ